ncbi:hypothetical protein [Peribacillus butanolivorans]
MQHLQFNMGEERFHTGIIMAVSFTRVAAYDTKLLKSSIVAWDVYWKP